MKRIRSFMVLSALVILLTVVASSVSVGTAAETPGQFYKGKVIEYVVAYAPGSTTDLLARHLAPQLSKYTGATVVVKNMGGAGGLEGLNYVWAAKPNGLTLGGIDLASLITNDLNDEPGARFQADKFGFLGAGGVEGSAMFVGAKSSLKTLDDFKARKGLKLAATSPAGNRAIANMIFAYFFNLDAKVITGYKGGKDCDLSVIQMETDASNTVSGSFLTAEKEGQIRGIVAVDNRPIPGMPHIRPMTDFLKLSAENKELLDVFLTVRPAKVSFVTPGIPPERLALLQEAFSKITKQEEFRNGFEKIQQYRDIAYMTGPECSAAAMLAKSKKKIWKERIEFLFDKYRAVN